MCWDIPEELKQKTDAEVEARWRELGNKKPVPSRPKMTTVPLDKIGEGKDKDKPARHAAQPTQPDEQPTPIKEQPETPVRVLEPEAAPVRVQHPEARPVRPAPPDAEPVHDEPVRASNVEPFVLRTPAPPAKPAQPDEPVASPIEVRSPRSRGSNSVPLPSLETARPLDVPKGKEADKTEEKADDKKDSEPTQDDDPSNGVSKKHRKLGRVKRYASSDDPSIEDEMLDELTRTKPREAVLPAFDVLKQTDAELSREGQQAMITLRNAPADPSDQGKVSTATLGIPVAHEAKTISEAINERIILDGLPEANDLEKALEKNVAWLNREKVDLGQLSCLDGALDPAAVAKAIRDTEAGAQGQPAIALRFEGKLYLVKNRATALAGGLRGTTEQEMLVIDVEKANPTRAKNLREFREALPNSVKSPEDRSA